MSHTIYAAKFEQTITFTTVLTVTIEIVFACFNCTLHIYKLWSEYRGLKR